MTFPHSAVKIVSLQFCNATLYKYVQILKCNASLRFSLTKFTSRYTRHNVRMELAVMCRYALYVWLTLMAGSNPLSAAYKYVNPWSPPFPASNLISFRDKLKYKFSLPRLRSRVKHKLDQSEDQFLQFRQKLKDKLVPQTPIRKQLTLPELPQITPNDIRTRILGLIPDSVTPSEFFSLVGNAVTATTLGAGYLGMSTELASQSSRIADNTAYISDTCERLNDLLDISYPQSTGGSTAPTPSPSPVSDKFGDVTAGSKSYVIIYPIGSGGSISLDGIHDNGLTYVTGKTVSSGDTTTSAALSIADFNIFRESVINAVDILDQKIRDILDVTKPTCP